MKYKRNLEKVKNNGAEIEILVTIVFGKRHNLAEYRKLMYTM